MITNSNPKIYEKRKRVHHSKSNSFMINDNLQNYKIKRQNYWHTCRKEMKSNDIELSCFWLIVRFSESSDLIKLVHWTFLKIKKLWYDCHLENSQKSSNDLEIIYHLHQWANKPHSQLYKVSKWKMKLFKRLN